MAHGRGLAVPAHCDDCFVCSGSLGSWRRGNGRDSPWRARQTGGTGPTDRFVQAGPGLESLDEPGFGPDDFSQNDFGRDDFGQNDFGGPDEADLLNKVMATMGPMLAAMQLGSAVGHLARTTMGSYELPIPRPDSSRLAPRARQHRALRRGLGARRRRGSPVGVPAGSSPCTPW